MIVTDKLSGGTNLHLVLRGCLAKILSHKIPLCKSRFAGGEDAPGRKDRITFIHVKYFGIFPKSPIVDEK